MIDALFNVAVFAALVLCIVGFSGWAHKRVDATLCAIQTNDAPGAFLRAAATVVIA